MIFSREKAKTPSSNFGQEQWEEHTRLETLFGVSTRLVLAITDEFSTCSYSQSYLNLAILYFQNVFSDSGRAHLFRQTNIETTLAVPVFSGRSKTPAFIFCCYSFVRSGSIPFVLKFVQQALKLLWGGLDKVEPHKTVDGDIWKDCTPADLGEMAADVEMHQHFMIKKRPIGAISTEMESQDKSINSLTAEVDSLDTLGGTTHTAPSIYTGQRGLEIETPSPQLIQRHTYEGIQNHLNDAIKSVVDMQPVHRHVPTNSNGSKRAHVFFQPSQIMYAQIAQEQPKDGQNESSENQVHGALPAVSTHLPLPQPFRLPNQVVQPTINEYPGATTLHQSLQEPIQRTAFTHQSHNQTIDNSVNPNHGYSFSSQQQQTTQQDQEIVPNAVLSIPMDNIIVTVRNIHCCNNY